MEFNRNPADANDVPYSKSPSIPLRLRQLFKQAGVPSTPDDKISWSHVPYALYNKEIYIAGLPATVFFANDKPTEADKAKRVREHLKWPPPGATESMKSLTNAFAQGNSVRLLPRPVGRDVIFELVSQDGTTFDLGQWKISAPVSSSVRKPTVASLPTAIIQPQPKPAPAPPIRTAVPSHRPEANSAKPAMTPAQNVPRATLSTSIPQPVASSSKATPPDPSAPEPYPKSPQVSLQLRRMLHAAGAPESKMHPGKVGWSLLPHYLWRKGLYIKGLPSLFVLEAKNPTLDSIERKMKAPFGPYGAVPGFTALNKAVERNEIAILKRPKDRDVVFEVITDSGPHDLGRWKDKEDTRPSTSNVRKSAPSSSAPPKPSTLPKKTVPVAQKPVRRATNGESSPRSSTPITPVSARPKNGPAITKTSKGKAQKLIESSSSEWKEESSSDGDMPVSAKPISKDFLDPISNPFPRSHDVPANLRRLLDTAGVKEDPSKPEIIPWATVPYVLWRNELYIKGLPILFVLGKNTPEEVIQREWKPQEVLRNNPTIDKAIIEGINNKGIQLLQRETARNVVFEVTDNNSQTISIGRWEAPEPIIVDEEMEESEEESSDQGDAPPLLKWSEEKNQVLDEFARLLVDGGVNLPPHPTRKNAYQIQWSSLPRLLHDARRTLAGFPLALLPFWRDFEKLNGRWTINWKRDSLDNLKDLLDCDAIEIEQWPEGRNSYYVVQAFDPNRTLYTFTLDDFLNAERDDPDQQVRNGVVIPLDPTIMNLRKRKATSDSESDRPLKRYKTRHIDTQSSSAAEMQDVEESDHMDTNDGFAAKPKEDAPKVVLPRRNLMDDVPLDPEMYWEQPWWNDDLSPAEKTKKSRWQKEILKNLIAILVYHDIPCIAPEQERLAYFLPWSNLPRHLAARDAYLMGWPQELAPVVDQDVVVPSMSGPASWGDKEWSTLKDALDKDQIWVEKRSSAGGRKQALFELVSSNGKGELSAVNFTKDWLGHNIGVEAGQPIGVMADEIAPYDPILNDTEDEYQSDVSMDD